MVIWIVVEKPDEAYKPTQGLKNKTILEKKKTSFSPKRYQNPKYTSYIMKN